MFPQQACRTRKLSWDGAVSPHLGFLCTLVEKKDVGVKAVYPSIDYPYHAKEAINVLRGFTRATSSVKVAGVTNSIDFRFSEPSSSCHTSQLTLKFQFFRDLSILTQRLRPTQSIWLISLSLETCLNTSRANPRVRAPSVTDGANSVQ